MAADKGRFSIVSNTQTVSIGSGPVDGGGGDGHDGDMEARIAALETANLETRDRLARIETRLDTVATKADLNAAVSDIQKSFTNVEKSLHALTWRVIGSCALLVGVAYFVAKHVG